MLFLCGIIYFPDRVSITQCGKLTLKNYYCINIYTFNLVLYFKSTLHPIRKKKATVINQQTV